MTEADEINNAVQEMKIMQISILGVSDMRWPGRGVCNVDGYSAYYAGNENAKHLGGVTIMVANHNTQSIKIYNPF